MKNSFLQSVTTDLYARYGDELSSFYVLLPNNRSRLFFVNELSEVVGKPIWSPHYTSIDELMSNIAEVQHVDRIRATVELYKVYSEYHAENFDSFFYWGEMLLSDFDAIDKYLINADTLFANILDIKTLEDDLSYLTEEQIDIIKRFWKSFDSSMKSSEEKEKFLNIWQTLAPIYHKFNAQLAKQGVAYTGQMQRIAAEKILNNELSDTTKKHFVVVGFNALSETEKVLFDHLRKNHNVDFYWDYDDYYLKDTKQEAGLFVRKNIKRYPLPEGFVIKSTFAESKKIVAISTPSDSLQCKYVSNFVEEILREQGKIDKRTAIVLTDEALLSPLLYSLPEEVEKVNITMGYPLRNSLVYSFIERLLLLQQRARVSKNMTAFYHSDITGLLTHPYVIAFNSHQANELKNTLIKSGRVYVKEENFSVGGMIEKIFTPHTDWGDLAKYIINVVSEVQQVLIDTESSTDKLLRREMFEIAIGEIRKLVNSLENCEITIETNIFNALLRRVLQAIRIPYSGEPLQGVQIMGILETRNLDFDNILILSMNDDTFPASRFNNSSFIPYNLRYAYGLPTPQHSEGVYAYYFYRLLQRATNVSLVYCSSSDEKSSGEQSRYIYQLEYESPHKIERRQVGIDVNLVPIADIKVEKCGEVLEKLNEYLDGGGRKLSPSGFNAYMECSLQFYFRYIAKLKTENEISEDIDLPMFGTILHKAMELLYTPIVGVENPQKEIQKIDKEQVNNAVVEAITREYLNGEQTPEEDYGGNLLMVKETVCKYISDCVLRYDGARDDFKILELEHKISCDFSFGEHSVAFSGASDRIDIMSDGMLRIIDYKTGSPHIDFNGIRELLAQISPKRNGAVLQTFLYAMMAERMQKAGDLEGKDVCPSLYYVRKMNNPEYAPFLNDKAEGRLVECYSDYGEELEELLAERLKELFDKNTSFAATDNLETCKYCDFAKICSRK